MKIGKILIKTARPKNFYQFYRKILPVSERTYHQDRAIDNFNKRGILRLIKEFVFDNFYTLLRFQNELLPYVNNYREPRTILQKRISFESIIIRKILEKNLYFCLVKKRYMPPKYRKYFWLTVEFIVNNKIKQG